MPTAPTGILSTPRSLLQSALAESDAFADWCELSPDANPLHHVHFSLFRQDDMRNFYPIALIDWRSFAIEQISGGGKNHLWPSPSNSLRLIFEDLDRGGTDPTGHDVASLKEGDTIFCNRLGAVLDDLNTIAGTGGALSITKIQMEQSPTRNPVQDWASINGRYIWTSLLVFYH